MSVVRCYNSHTGHVETVSSPVANEIAESILRLFVSNDPSDTHVYFLDALSEADSATR